MEVVPDPRDPDKLTVRTDMGQVLQQVAARISGQVDAELRRMFTWLHRVAARAEPAQDPQHDQQAQNHALFWLGEILQGRRPTTKPADDGERRYGVWQHGNWLGELNVTPKGRSHQAWWEQPSKAMPLTRSCAESLAKFIGSSAEVRRLPA